MQTLSSIPYNEVVEVEQELIKEGLPESEVLKLCDVHSAVLKGNIDLSTAKKYPTGHPLDIMVKENEAIKKLTAEIASQIQEMVATGISPKLLLSLRANFNMLYDVDNCQVSQGYCVKQTCFDLV